MEERVTLIIKAANQSTPDQRLECDARWSVSALKGHLAKSHPSHPNTEEQRLIYSGQLLADHHLLCNVLRRPSEDNAYTIHLVCSQPPPPLRQPHPQPSPSRTTNPTASQDTTGVAGMANPSPAPAVASSSSTSGGSNLTNGQAIDSSTDGLRRRHPTSTTPPTLDSPGPPPTTTSTTATTMPLPAVGGVLQPSADPIHQVAAMQQIYAHYMAYVQYMQMGGGVGGLPWPQQMIQIPPPPNPATATTAAAAATTPTAPTEPAEQPQPDPNQPADPQPQPQPQQPIRMNAQGGEVEEDEEEEGAARDWLDWVYVLSRMVVLLSIVYFYSTLSRFMVVVFIAMLLYLYQAGWFRPSRRVDAPPPQVPNPPHHHHHHGNNNNNNNNNNINNNDPRHTPPREEEDGEDEEEEEEEEEEAAAPRRDQALGSEDGGPQEVPIVVRPSLLSLSWTFLTSFFTSLIPEQPQGI